MKIKNTILASITGIGIGMPITLLCMTVIGGFNSVIKEFLVWLIASALFGVLSLIFKSYKLSLPVVTAIHCIGCFAVTCGACAVIGYSDNFSEILLAVVPVFVIVYAVLYIVALAVAKREAKKVNEALDKKA